MAQDNDTALTELPFANLQLLPGHALQLEMELNIHKEDRFRCNLIGYRIPHSIIVTAPTEKGITVNGLLDKTAKVRLFSSRHNGACAFESKVLELIRKPYPHLHLTVPETIYLGEVRKSIRANVNLITSIHLNEGADGEKFAGAINDLSVDGAGIASKTLTAECGDEIELVTRFSISGIDKIITIKAIVRSKNDSDTGTQFGLQFIELDEDDKLMIHACVLSHLYNTPTS